MRASWFIWKTWSLVQTRMPRAITTEKSQSRQSLSLGILQSSSYKLCRGMSPSDHVHSLFANILKSFGSVGKVEISCEVSQVSQRKSESSWFSHFACNWKVHWLRWKPTGTSVFLWACALLRWMLGTISSELQPLQWRSVGSRPASGDCHILQRSRTTKIQFSLNLREYREHIHSKYN